jgi:hypothetical protein
MVLVAGLLFFSSLSFAKTTEHFACQTYKAYVEFHFVDRVDWNKMGHNGHNWIHLEYNRETAIGVGYFHEAKDISPTDEVLLWIQQNKFDYADVKYYSGAEGTFAKYNLKSNPTLYYWVLPVNGTRETLVIPQTADLCGPQHLRNWFEQAYRLFFK